MPYKIAIREYIGGEVRYTASPFSLETGTNKPKSIKEEKNNPVGESPLLVYSAQLETEVGGLPQSGYGALAARVCKFTRSARTTIQRCARALDEVANSPSEILFCTGTLPGTGSKQYKALAQWSSWVVHRLKAWIAKRIEAKLDFYCWEYQKRGALHLHYAVHCPDRAARIEISSEFKNEWMRLLDYVSEVSGVDLYYNSHRGFSHSHRRDRVRADAEEVEYSVGRYLGKYLSKSSEAGSGSGFYPPCRWYGVSRSLRELERRARRHLTMTFPTAGDWLAAIEEFQSVLHLASDVVFHWSNKVIGGCGGVAYEVKKHTVDTLLMMRFGEAMQYRDINQKIRLKWASLLRVLFEIDSRYPKWTAAMRRRHPAIARWDEWINMSGDVIVSPNGIELAQHVTWGLQDLLRDWQNTRFPPLPGSFKNELIYVLSELDSSLCLYYEFDLRESQDDNPYR